MSTDAEQAKESSVVEFAPLEFPPVEYGVTEAALAELAERFKDPDASTDDGYEHCKNGCRELSALRSGVETRRLNLKRPVTEWVRTHIDKRGKDLIRRIRKIEGPVRVEKERVDEIQQAIARKAAEAEQARVDAIKANIKKIADTAVLWNIDDTAADYQHYITWLTELAITDEIFGEFVDDAKTERDAALFKLGQWHERAEQREADDIRRKAEQAKLDEEREELEAAQEKQRKAEAELEQKNRETAERETAAEKQREKIEREAAQRKADLEKVLREENEAAEREKAEAEKKRINLIRNFILLIKGVPAMSEEMSADSIDGVIVKVKENIPEKAAFQEFLPEAKTAWQQSLDTLDIMAKDARNREEQVRRDDEARLPDRDKLLRWCDAIAEIPEPEVLNEKAQKTLRRYTGDLAKFLDRLRSDIGKL